MYIYVTHDSYNHHSEYSIHLQCIRHITNIMTLKLERILHEYRINALHIFNNIGLKGDITDPFESFET